MKWAVQNVYYGDCVYKCMHTSVCMDKYVHALLRVLFPLESSEGETIQIFL